MIKKTGEAPNDQFRSFVCNWFTLISLGKWDQAFSQIDLPPNFGEPYTPETFRNEVENDHFREGTVFRRRHPEGIVYSNPELISDDVRYIIHDECKDISGFGFEFDVPLNGEWSDLTSGWEFIHAGEFYKVRLDWLHVL